MTKVGAVDERVDDVLNRCNLVAMEGNVGEFVLCVVDHSEGRQVVHLVVGEVQFNKRSTERNHKFLRENNVSPGIFLTPHMCIFSDVIHFCLHMMMIYLESN